MLFVFIVLIGLIPALIASTKGRSFAGWWIYGSLLFIAALPHVLLIGPAPGAALERPLAEGTKRCDFCAEIVQAAARVCRYCNRDPGPTPAALDGRPA